MVVAVPGGQVLVAVVPAAVAEELVSGAAAGPLVARQVLVHPLAVVSVVGQRVPVPVVGAVVARPVLLAGPVVPRARAASPSGRSARSSTTCRHRQ
jgi:hypothetical protein